MVLEDNQPLVIWDNRVFGRRGHSMPLLLSPHPQNGKRSVSYLAVCLQAFARFKSF